MRTGDCKRGGKHVCAPLSHKHDLRRRRAFVPAARWFGRHGADVLDRKLTATRLRAFHLDLVRVAGLLVDLLVRRELVADVENLRRLRCQAAPPAVVSLVLQSLSCS